ncbi:MAG: hypothetical protein Q4F07_06785 [Bacteroidales bacterium]|nr:hypothetical protein [Bacteroidales bacterium]
MKRIEIQINGEAYPCSLTMGAMLRFKQETGREITEIDAASFSDLCTYLWCCVISASKREGRRFDMTLMEFADSIDPADMEQWTKSLEVQNGAGDSEGETEEQEKKSL